MSQLPVLRPRSIPHEIFLLIVDAIVDEAEARAYAYPATWWLTVWVADETEQFAVFQTYERPGLAPRGLASSLVRKFDQLSNISGVSRSALRLVERRFSRLPSYCTVDGPEDRPPRMSHAWAHPKVDFFHPVPECLIRTRLRSTFRLNQAVKDALLHQSPRGKQTIAHIQNVVFAPVWWEEEDRAEASRALQAIPNHKVFRLGLRVPVRALPEKFCGREAVIPLIAPEVLQIRKYLADEDEFWRPFLEMGIRIMLDGEVFDFRKTRYLLELFRTEDGLHLRHVEPESHWVRITSPLRLPWPLTD